MGREGRGGGKVGKGREGRGAGEKGRGRSSPNVRDALTPLVPGVRRHELCENLRSKAENKNNF